LQSSSWFAGCEIKERVMLTRDEFGQAFIKAILNFGHTMDYNQVTVKTGVNDFEKKIYDEMQKIEERNTLERILSDKEKEKP
jgi:hypothetical protein